MKVEGNFIRKSCTVVGGMELVFVLLLLVPSVSCHIRTVRNAYQFKNVIKCTTEYTLRSIFYYNFYGCYCGLNGANNPYKGKDPVDELDRCCREHDQCYYDARRASECNSKAPYFLTYKWDCIYERAKDGSNLSNKVANCTDSQNSCGLRVCQCDKLAAECFAQHPPLSGTKKCPRPITNDNSTKEINTEITTFSPSFEATQNRKSTSFFSINVDSIDTSTLNHSD